MKLLAGVGRTPVAAGPAATTATSRHAALNNRARAGWYAGRSRGPGRPVLPVDPVKAPPLGVLENTDDVHNLVVCTLCSCYPRAVLGYPPFWFKSAAYRARGVRDPRGLIAEWGTVLPEGVKIRVVDSTADYRWMVLPRRPAGTEGWSEDRLAAIVREGDMIGVTVPSLPAR